MKGRIAPSAPPADMLTPEDERFCELYVESRNRVASAEAAYGLGKLKARSVAYQALQRPLIRARLTMLGAPALERAHITADRVMLQLARHGFRDVRRAFDDAGNMLPPHLMDDDTAASIVGFETETVIRGRGEDAYPVTVTKVKFVDPTVALTTLAKHFKLVGDVDDGIASLAGELAARLGAARKRAQAMGDVVDVEERGVGGGGEPVLVEGAIPLRGSHPQQIASGNSEIPPQGHPQQIAQQISEIPPQPAKNNTPASAQREPRPEGKGVRTRASNVTLPQPQPRPQPQETPDEEPLW